MMKIGEIIVCKTFYPSHHVYKGIINAYVCLWHIEQFSKQLPSKFACPDDRMPIIKIRPNLIRLKPIPVHHPFHGTLVSH